MNFFTLAVTFPINGAVVSVCKLNIFQCPYLTQATTLEKGTVCLSQKATNFPELYICSSVKSFGL